MGRACAVAVFLWFTAIGSAHATPPTIDDVRILLSGYERSPSSEEIRALGPETFALLRALYARRDESPFVRIRAVEAIAAFPTPEARAFLKAVAAEPNQSDLFVRTALTALFTGFGDSALPDIAPYLRSDRPVVRECAVRVTARARLRGRRAR